MQQVQCPLFRGVSTSTVPSAAAARSAGSEDANATSDDTAAAASPSANDAKLDGLRQYARQTLQQYANGATLSRLRVQQSAAKDAVATLNKPVSEAGAPHRSPNMVYMQNLTAIVLLTIESLQLRGLVQPRHALVHVLRSRLGMAAAPAPKDTGCAHVPFSLPSMLLEVPRSSTRLHVAARSLTLLHAAPRCFKFVCCVTALVQSRSTVDVWQTTDRCCEYCQCTAPETIRLPGVLGVCKY